MTNIKKMTAVLLGLLSFILAISQANAATVLDSTSCTDTGVMAALSAHETAFAAKDITALGNLIDANFLKAAQNKTALLTQWNNLFSATSVQETLGSVSCAPNATAGLEDVLTFQTITKTVGGVTSSQMSLQHFVLKSNVAGGWVFYGNQKNFEFQFGTVSHINPTTGSGWIGLNLFVDDPVNLVASVAISGPGISGAANLFSFSKPNGNGTTGTGWKNYNQATNVNVFPAVMPALPATYTLTVTEKSGTVTTKTLNYTAFNTNYPTALIPSGNYTATTPPTFSWTAPATGQYAYGLQVNTMPTAAGATTMVWNPNNSFPGTSLPYTGATLAAGSCYSYNVTATDINGNMAQTDGYLGMNTAACLPAAVSGTGTHTASGTYTWDSVAGTLALSTTTSDFTCDGPSLGTKTNTGVVITATTMTWPGKTDAWTRASGTAGSIVGTWTFTNSATGNSFALTFNTSGTASVTGVIAQCGSSGGNWVAMAPIPSASYGLGGAFVGGKFYAVSGFATAQLGIYDPATNTWTSGASLPADTGYNLRQYFGTAVLGGKIYVVGGDTGGSGDRDTLLRYDPALNTWTTLAPMPLGARYELGATAINGKIYAVGGVHIGNSTVLSRLEVYDPVTNTWVAKASMPTPHYAALVGAINGKLYVAGGVVDTAAGTLTTELDIYDPVADSWTTGAPMPFTGNSDGGVVLGGKLFSIGGGPSPESRVFAYDAATNSWSTNFAPMPTGRRAIGVAADEANNKIYAVGGYNGGYVSALEVFTPQPNPGMGTHTASGTYTWNSTTGVVTWNWTASDFVGCDGPSLGTKTNTGVVITATTMTWPGKTEIWTRASGTAGSIVGTWTATDSMTGNSYTVTVNANSTVSVSAVIVMLGNCGGGNPNLTANAMSQHWSNGYSVQLQYSDSPKTATAVSVTGPGITGSKSLAYNTGNGQWDTWTAPGSAVDLGTTLPTGLPYTYTFTITPATGAPTTATSTVSCFQAPFVTNISPTGSVTGTGNPTFSWTGIADTSAVYGVQVNDSNGNWLWANYNIPGTSIAYNGPALTPGVTYGYAVSVQSSSTCSGGNSFVPGSFTYGNGTAAGYAGTYSGTYSGSDTGTWTATVSSSGAVTATVNTGTLGSISGSGQVVSSTGVLTITTSGTVAGVATFTGTVNSTTGAVSGTWTGFNSMSGSFSGAVTPTGVSQFDGTYTGSWSNSDSGNTAAGTFATTLVNGVFTNTTFTTTSGNFGILFTSGAVSSSGAITGIGATPSQCSSSGGTFTGQITGAGMTMSYSRTASGTCAAESGAMTATRVNPTVTHTLAVSKSGTGSGTVSAPTGFSCNFSGGSCTDTQSSGAVITYTATPDTVSTFTGWSGACTGTGACVVTMDASKSVTAIFGASVAPAPTVTLSATPSSIANGATSVISWSSTDSTSCASSSGGGTGTTGSFTTPSLTAAATYTVTCTGSGGTASRSVTVTVAAVPGTALNFASSWNLVGNSANAPLTVAATFGDATKIQTVWKWIPATSKWAFYTPTMTDGGSAYAAGKGYDFLTTINGGEGFWVNAKVGFTASLPAGTAVTTASFQDQVAPPNPLPAGWSLISVGDNPNPLVFNNRIGQIPPATGAIATNLTTLWAWDSATTGWYFYAPSLDAAGTLASYITGKNYHNFFAPTVKVLDPTMGFWVNRPASAGAPSTTAVAISSIQTQMTAFQNLFATAKPAATDPALAAPFDASFLDNGMDKAVFIAMLVDPNNGLNVGDQFVGVAAVTPLDAGAVANDATHQWFTFTIRPADGYVSHDNGGVWLAIKDTVTGNWLNAGNRRHVGVGVRAQANQQIPSAAQIATGAATMFSSGINLDVHTGTGGGGAAALAAAGVTSVLATGPGIVSANGVTIYSSSSGQNNWVPPCGSQGPTGTITTDCMNVSQATAGSRYTFSIFTTAGGAAASAYTYTEALYAAPVPVAGLTAANFPAITSVTPATFTFASGATVTVNWTLPAGLKSDWMDINGWGSVAPYGRLFQTGSNLSGAALTKSLVVPAYTGALGRADVYLQARDVNGTSYVTSKQY